MAVHEGHRDRKRKQFLTHGIDVFADHEILELLLFYAIPRRDTNPMAHALMDRFGSLHAVLDAPLEELASVPGVGPSGAAIIKLVPQMYKRIRSSLTENEVILDTTQRISSFFAELLSGRENDVMLEVCMDAKGRVLTSQELTAAPGVANVRAVVQNALICNAVLVAIAHRCPRGAAAGDDHAFAREIRRTLDALDITLADYVIFSDDRPMSLRRSGFLDY